MFAKSQVCPHTPKGGLYLKKVGNLPFIQFNPPLGQGRLVLILEVQRTEIVVDF
jgi:hypothetical protein